MRNTKRKMRYIFDLILVFALLAVSLSVYFFLRSKSDTGAVVRVYIGNETVAEYPLSEDGEYPLNGGSNILKIENGEAYMLSADCPDKRCVNQGRISELGERVTCLPNRVMLKIVK